MCNINIIKRKDEMPDKRINEYMDVASLYSFVSNNDGEGYIGLTSNSIKIDRSLNKIKYSRLPIFHTLMTHQRLTTSGMGLNNTHPHEGQYFIIQHNGIFTGMGNKEKSDTKYYLEKLEMEYEKSGDVIMSIKSVTKNIGGSFSIVLFDKKTLKTYYYKDDSTNMYKIENNRYVIMSTVEKNLRMAKLFFGMKSDVKEVKGDNIYELTINGLKFIGKIGIVRPKIYYINDNGVTRFKESSHNDKYEDEIYRKPEIFYDDIKSLEEYQDEARRYRDEHKGWDK